MMRNSTIAGTGMYVPPRVVSNKELAVFLGTEEEWILRRTGICERRYVADGFGTSDLGREASLMAIDNAEIDLHEIDLIIFATLSPDVFFPGSSCYLQAKLGLPGVPTLDIRNQCSGFVYGLSICNSFIKAGYFKCILLVGAEVHSTGLDLSPTGRDISALFGDGAGAVVVTPCSDATKGILAIHLGADGSEADTLACVAPRSSPRPRISADMLERGLQFPQMNGKRVFRAAVHNLSESVRILLDRARLGVGDVKLFILHQANLRILEKVASDLGLASDQLYTNIDRYGNTTAASIPIALHEALAGGLISDGDLVVLGAFGSGFTWGSMLIRW